MPLTKCPECNKDVSSQATACPHCGYPLNATPDNSTPHASPPTPPTPPRGSKLGKTKLPKGCKIGCLSTLAILGIVIFVPVIFHRSAPTSETSSSKSERVLTFSGKNLVGFTISEGNLPPSLDTVYPYSTGNGAFLLKVVQSMKDGVLVCGDDPNLVTHKNPDKLLFIKSKKPYARDDFLEEGYFIYTGLLKYKTILGATAEVYSFEETDKPNEEPSPKASAVNAEPEETQELVRRGMAISKEGRLIEGAKLFQIAAERGNINAQFLLGCCYQKGEGVPVNREEAIKWLRECQARGDASAGESADAVQIRSVALLAKLRLKSMGAQ